FTASQHVYSATRPYVPWTKKASNTMSLICHRTWMLWNVFGPLVTCRRRLSCPIPTTGLAFAQIRSLSCRTLVRQHRPSHRTNYHTFLRQGLDDDPGSG